MFLKKKMEEGRVWVILESGWINVIQHVVTNWNISFGAILTLISQWPNTVGNCFPSVWGLFLWGPDPSSPEASQSIIFGKPLSVLMLRSGQARKLSLQKQAWSARTAAPISTGQGGENIPQPQCNQISSETSKHPCYYELHRSLFRLTWIKTRFWLCTWTWS